MQRSESRFWADVGLVLLAKCFFLLAVWAVFFGPSHQLKPDPARVQHHITGDL